MTADSPRLYVNRNPTSPSSIFVAVADSVEDIQEILQCLHSPPKAQDKASGPFAKAKKPKQKSKDVKFITEGSLHKALSSFLQDKLEADDSPYFTRLARVKSRRYNLIKKRDREARAAILEADRALHPFQDSRPLRSSTRLRPARNGNGGYNENTGDQELERALRESERTYGRKRRRSGSEYEDVDYTGMFVDNDDEENLDDEDEWGNENNDEDGDQNGRRKSSRKTAAKLSKPTIPGERRSLRARPQAAGSSDEENDDDLVYTKATVVRSFSPVRNDSPPRFGGLEEIWSMNKYMGYNTPNGTFIKAQKGDVPLYKLAKMGLPMPNSHDKTENGAMAVDGVG